MPPWVEEDSIAISDCFADLSAIESIPWYPPPRLGRLVPTVGGGSRLSARPSTRVGGEEISGSSVICLGHSEVVMGHGFGE
jgi:hypothetical protein